MSAILKAVATDGIALTARAPDQDALLTLDALAFLAALHRRFEPERQARLAARESRQAAFDAGALPDFRRDTADVLYDRKIRIMNDVVFRDRFPIGRRGPQVAERCVLPVAGMDDHRDQAGLSLAMPFKGPRQLDVVAIV